MESRTHAPRREIGPYAPITPELHRLLAVQLPVTPLDPQTVVFSGNPVWEASSGHLK